MQNNVFVAREREIDQLDHFLDLALQAQGQVCFVIGEAGSGKTALLAEFARRAQERHDELVVAVGQSDAQTGAGDAYLPFREMLGQLTGDVDAKLSQGAITETNAGRLKKLLGLSGQALVEVGPDLIGVFVPGAGLATRVAGFVAEKAGWLDKLEQLTQRQQEEEGPGSTGIDQSQIFEQYTNVLNRLAEKQPLLLMVDDLQWADAASIGLLFRLGRRIGGSRILLVGTYRPDEVALGRGGERHPLEKVLAELKRYYGDVSIDLGGAREEEGRYFVDAFLDTEPNHLGEGFRRSLYHHTGGHPLFTIELLRAMQERGDLVRDEQEEWVEGATLDWAALPARVEGVIEERIGRLAEELQEALRVASVEGEDFTAEVVAGVQSIEARGLVRRLSGELEKQHHLVGAQGTRRLGAQRLCQYRFQHNLFQKYLYNNLDEVERSYLHEDVGNLLEALYGDSVDEITVQLAWHFTEADVADKAARYLAQAGIQAAVRYANAEAVDYLSRALDLTPDDCTDERYELLSTREQVYNVLGAREAQARDLAALQACAQALGDEVRQAEVALRQAAYAEVTGDYPAAIESVQRAIELAQANQASGLEAAGHWRWGETLFHLGEYGTAQTQLDLALALARGDEFYEVEAGSLCSLGQVQGARGNSAEAQSHFERALEIYRQNDARRGTTAALNGLAITAAQQGRWDEAVDYFEQVLDGFRQIGERRGEGAVLSNLGTIAHLRNDYAGAGDYFRQCLPIHREINDRRGECMALCNLGATSLTLGDYVEARTALEESLAVSRDIGQRQAEGQGLLYLGLVSHHLGDDEQACSLDEQARQIAEEIGDRMTGGTALIYLGHGQTGLGRLDQAADSYQRALDLRREIGQPALVAEALAGLAEVSLARNDLPQALAGVEEILPSLEANALMGAEEPFWVYLTCYRVLEANQDPRAQGILDSAYTLLQERAALISDEGARRSFLDAVPIHREIVRAWESQER